MTEPRDPPYPADTRAKGWRFELDYERIEQSDTWRLGTKRGLRGTLLLLWYEAWKQTPCGTLPDDDEVLAALCDMESEQFAAARQALLRRWWKASDGRLYHPQLMLSVRTMLDARKVEADRKAAWRAKREAAKGLKHGEKFPLESPPESRGTMPMSHGTDDTSTSTSTRVKNTEPTVLVLSGEPSAPPDTPYQGIVDLYHRHLSMLPRVAVLNEGRKRTIAARWREVVADPEIARAQNPRAAGLDWFAWFFQHAAGSRFLTGKVNDWRADFDFLITQSKFAKVLEGSYHKDPA